MTRPLGTHNRDSCSGHGHVDRYCHRRADMREEDNMINDSLDDTSQKKDLEQLRWIGVIGNYYN